MTRACAERRQNTEKLYRVGGGKKTIGGRPDTRQEFIFIRLNNSTAAAPYLMRLKADSH